jgi:hypothetical protein
MAAEAALPAQLPYVFPYRPLTQTDSIRLNLVLPAATYKEPVQCSLIHIILSECKNDIFEHYMALSYVWGSVMDLKTIIVDRSRVSVTVNLYSALRDLRDPAGVLRLWADALCIDQSNNNEKGMQIAMMGKIYAAARHTVIYLGQLDPRAEVMLLHATKSDASDSSLASLGKLKLQAAQYILSKEWFRRVWVFQELVFSKDP